MITTARCEDPEAYRALEVDEDGFDPSWDEQNLEFSPELGIYPVLRPNPGMLQPVAASPNPTDLSLARYSEVDVLVEVRRATAFPTPASFHPLSAMSCGTVSLLDDAPQFGFQLDGDEDPLEDSVIRVFNMQHRLFVFMMGLFVEDKARLLRFDRTGVIMTPDFDYTQRPEVIGKFLYRLSQNRASIGHDPTATRASNVDTALFRNLHTHYHPASAVGRGLRDASIED